MHYISQVPLFDKFCDFVFSIKILCLKKTEIFVQQISNITALWLRIKLNCILQTYAYSSLDLTLLRQGKFFLSKFYNFENLGKLGELLKWSTGQIHIKFQCFYQTK
jgi:hypothetical protein